MQADDPQARVRVVLGGAVYCGRCGQQIPPDDDGAHDCPPMPPGSSAVTVFGPRGMSITITVAGNRSEREDADRT